MTQSTRERVHTVTDSPLGKLTLVAAQGKLCGLYMPQHRHSPDPATFGPRDDEGFGTVITQLGQYFDGTRATFDVPLTLEGTPFQRRVWQALVDIPYGQTRSYAALASALGNPAASRAVGLANGRNPISIIVPCHRVVASSGKLAGYAGGLERKRFLLDLESGRALIP